MRKSILLILLCASFFTLKAQNASELKHEFGVSTAFLSDALFNSNDANPYLLTYKYILGRDAFRLGLGGSYLNNSDDDENSTITKDIAYDLAARLGYEKRFSIKEKWLASFGFDVGYQVLGLVRETSDFFNGTSSDVRSTSSNIIYNVGLVGGLQFYINDRISISTETSIMANFRSNTSKVDFDNGFEDFEDTNNSTLIAINLPTSLYLVLRF